MPRPRKKGLSYFPLDVDIFEDDKVFDLQNEYGPLGEVIYIRLLCLVYRNGYYYRFDSKDKLAAMMIRSIGNRWAKDKKTVIEVIDYLAKINLFSSELMQRNILTSRGIQERYLLAVERRQSTIVEYSLLEKNYFHEGFESAPKNPVSVAETPVNVTETAVNVSKNATKESKVKESKEKESKGEESGGTSSPSALAQLIDDYGKETVDRYIRRVETWYADKGKQLNDLYGKVRSWLEQDGVKKRDAGIEKYKCVINKF